MISQPGKRDFQIIDIKVMVWNFNFKSLVHHRMIKNFSRQSSARILSYTRQHFSQNNNNIVWMSVNLKKNDELL